MSQTTTRILTPEERLRQWFADRLSGEGEYDLATLRRECAAQFADDDAFLTALGRATLSRAVERAARSVVDALRRNPRLRTIEASTFLAVRPAPAAPSRARRAWWRPFADDYHVPFVDLRKPDLLTLAERAKAQGRDAVYAAIYFHQLAELLPNDEVTVGEAIRPATRQRLEAMIEQYVGVKVYDTRLIAAGGTRPDDQPGPGR